MKQDIFRFEWPLLKTILFLIFLLVEFFTSAQTTSRITLNMNKDWRFVKGDRNDASVNWQTVQLPHTWNKEDVLDDEPGYYRGVGWYRKLVTIDPSFRNKELTLYFEGTNQEADVFVNGKYAGHHVGGYTAFSIPVTKFLQFDKPNELLVKVDNSYNADIAPLTADFTFYGGIYRDVYLIANNKIHFSTTDAGSNGVYIATPFVSEKAADITITSKISNATDAVQKIIVVTAITDGKGETIEQVRSIASVNASSEKTIVQKISAFHHPRLWSPEDPYLYKVVSTISDDKGKVLDVLTNPLGFRWFHFDADKGFFLNGRLYKLVGASRHQDYKGLGNAVPDSLAVQDVVALKKMGANFLRVAHYPQDPSVMKACDSLGLLASVEIPVVNEITESDSFYNHCMQMQKEMIRQNYNHPSVIIWCYMNEVLLKMPFANNKDRQNTYLSNVLALARRLDSFTRKEDPFRYTMMANHGNLAQYKNAGLLEIPMIVGWNLYSGWYGGSMDDFPLFLDRFHTEFSGRPFMVTEYGADADPRIRSDQPVRFDKSIEFTTRFHQYYFTEMMKRSYVAGAVIWNLADFNSETRTETMPHMNNKGLLEWDRKPKDAYYFYKAVLSKQPFIKILGCGENRFAIADSTSPVCYRSIQIAGNLDSVTIILNGKEQTKLKLTNGLGESKLSFNGGMNTVIAESKKDGRVFRDSLRMQIHLQPPCLTSKQIPFTAINILLGSNRYFTDEKGEWWQPDQSYQSGGWGSIGGRKFKIENNGRLPYGTDKNITGTDNDPVYQTQQTGIRQYRLDVLPGKYEVTLHFAELLGGQTKIPPYNLNEDNRHDTLMRRIFSIKLNGQILLNHFNIADQYGLARAVVKSTTVTVINNESILIDFLPVEGEPVLNALQVKKID
jgi:beta-galactosidase